MENIPTFAIPSDAVRVLDGFAFQRGLAFYFVSDHFSNIGHESVKIASSFDSAGTPKRAGYSTSAQTFVRSFGKNRRRAKIKFNGGKDNFGRAGATFQAGKIAQIIVYVNGDTLNKDTRKTLKRNNIEFRPAQSFETNGRTYVSAWELTGDGSFLSHLVSPAYAGKWFAEWEFSHNAAVPAVHTRIPGTRYSHEQLTKIGVGKANADPSVKVTGYVPERRPADLVSKDIKRSNRKNEQLRKRYHVDDIILNPLDMEKALVDSVASAELLGTVVNVEMELIKRRDKVSTPNECPIKKLESERIERIRKLSSAIERNTDAVIARENGIVPIPATNEDNRDYSEGKRPERQRNAFSSYPIPVVNVPIVAEIGLPTIDYASEFIALLATFVNDPSCTRFVTIDDDERKPHAIGPMTSPIRRIGDYPTT